MHPEIVQEKPGNCPECGMALVLVKNNKETKSLQQHVSNTPIGYKGHNHI
jgi:Cu2+-exporting ATPase